MKKLTYLLLPFLLIIISWSTVFAQTAQDSEKPIFKFDAELATELGADNYGMKRYVIALLKTGPNRDFDRETAAELQRGHMANINRLADEGKLIVAGPFLDGGELRGIFIFNVDSVEEARELTESDPAIKAGSLAVELYNWYGSAALIKTTEIHSKIARESP